MVGQECKQFELNIDKFVQFFQKPGELLSDNSFAKLRIVTTLYRMFNDLAKDIRSKECNMERIDNFGTRAENFFQFFKKNCMGFSTGRKPYLHILRDHIADFMKF